MMYNAWQKQEQTDYEYYLLKRPAKSGIIATVRISGNIVASKRGNWKGIPIYKEDRVSVLYVN